MRRAAAVMVNVKKLEREKPAVGSLKFKSGCHCDRAQTALAISDLLDSAPGVLFAGPNG